MPYPIAVKNKNRQRDYNTTMKTTSKKINKFALQTCSVLKFASILIALFFFNADPVKAQDEAPRKPGVLTGFIVDDEFNEPLEKAVVSIPGTLISVLTDQQGKYMLQLKGGDYLLEVTYPGYFGKKYNISVSDGITTPMFIIKLKPEEVGKTMQRRITSFENKHRFPQSTENLNVWKIAEQKGNQEFNESFRTIPSVNLLSNGSGYNDSEIGFRGNDATHTSYTFNGISLNNPETGRMNPSILSGMTDWAGQIQVTNGQAANLQSQTNSGGLINVLSFLPHEKFGGEVLAVYGNNGLLKTTATVHSGISKKRLASSLQISRTSGNGVVQNTAFEQYGFALNIHKEFNHRNTLIFNMNGIAQQHDRNRSDTIGAYNLYGTKYNQNWGKLNEKPLSWSTNYGRSPLISLTHFWQPRLKTHITTQIFAQFNRSAQLMPGGSPLGALPRDSIGQILFDKISDWNKGLNVTEIGTSRLPDASGKFMNSDTTGISTISAINSENRFGLRSVLTHNFSKELDLSSSFSLEQYQASHFGAVNNLLGADGYIGSSDMNNSSGTPIENLYKPKLLGSYNSAGKTVYSYESGIQTGGFSFRVNYHPTRFYWYFEGTASIQNRSRTDHFNYLSTDPAKKSETDIIPGGRVQTGIRVNLWKYHSMYLRTNYGSYQPLFNVQFPSGNNWKNEQAKNEQVLDVEVGYTILSRRLKIEALAYRSDISNRAMVRYSNLNPGDSFGLINELNELHQGVELKAAYKFTKNFQFNVNGSLGDWKYSQDTQAQLFDQDNLPSSENELWLKNVKIGNAPQLSIFAEAEYRWAHNLYFRLNYYRGDQIYAPFGLMDFNNLTDRSEFKQWKMPAFNLLGFSGNYLLTIRKAQTLNLIFGGQNLLDTEYIEQSATNMNEENPGYTGNLVQYGMGRTWFLGIKYQF